MSSSTQFVDSEPVMAAQASPAVSMNSPVAMTGRRPMRSETAPAIGEMSMGVAKKGSRRTAGELELLGDEEAGGEDRARHEEGRGVAGRERAAEEQAQRQHRLADALFPGSEGD